MVGNKLILVIIITLLVSLLSVFINFLRPEDKEVVQVTFMVGSSPGFDINRTALSFGRVVPGSTTHRNISVQNNKNYPLTGKVIASEEMKEFLSFEPQFTIEPNSVRSFSVYLVVPKSSDYANYTGKLRIELYK